MIHVDITNEQSRLPIDEGQLRAAVAAVLAGESIARATISLAVVDDPMIHALNQRYLDHDYPTDVLSFALDGGPGFVDGEIVVSGDTAARTAPGFNWTGTDELLLYVIHGALHLAGYDDQSPADAARMRAREAHYLSLLGLRPRAPERAEAADALVACESTPLAEGHRP